MSSRYTQPLQEAPPSVRLTLAPSYRSSDTEPEQDEAPKPITDYDSVLAYVRQELDDDQLAVLAAAAVAVAAVAADAGADRSSGTLRAALDSLAAPLENAGLPVIWSQEEADRGLWSAIRQMRD